LGPKVEIALGRNVRDVHRDVSLPGHVAHLARHLDVVNRREDHREILDLDLIRSTLVVPSHMGDLLWIGEETISDRRVKWERGDDGDVSAGFEEEE
jgi:hypothetical protein